jgi:hypothetical protein
MKNYLRLIKPVGLSVDNLVYMNLAENMNEPFYLVFHHEGRTIVGIRGTITFDDCRIDLDATPIPI